MDLSVLQTITSNFIHELTLSEKGEKTSLAYIRNEIPSTSLVQDGEIFQVMIIGGTNYQSAILKKTPDGLDIIKKEPSKQPPIFKTNEDLFILIKNNFEEDTKLLAINFAFPLQPIFAHGKLEGTVLYASKEHIFEGLLGKNLCTEIENYIEKNLGRQIKVSAANDTICLLLSGKTQISHSNLGAGIVGTGLNFSFFENPTTLINTESGNFNKFPITPTLQKLDEKSNVKERYLFEKAISGAYLYKHFNILAPQKNINKIVTSTEELDDLAREENAEGTLAKEILQNSAQLVACAIAGILNFKQTDMTFVMQGSVFWKGYQYKEIVAETVKKLSPNYSAEFIKVENADILGAAKLVA